MKTLIIMILMLVACGETPKKPPTRAPEKLLTEAEVLSYVKRTYEFAYIQGAQDATDKITAILRDGGKEKLEMQYFMTLKERRLKEFLEGKK
jgi:hypothetical protein